MKRQQEDGREIDITFWEGGVEDQDDNDQDMLNICMRFSKDK